MHTTLDSLYQPCTCCLSSERERSIPTFDEGIFWRAARYIYRRRGFDRSMLVDKPVREAINETHRVISHGVSKGIQYEVPDTIRHALDNNAFVFSGFKVYHSLREVGLSLTTEEGEIKPYRAFLADVKRINARYNHNYLEAEYDHAVGSAMMASKWHHQTSGRGKHKLQYRTADDNRVRPEHQLLEGITLPASDKFWTEFYPPNGWRCRCDVVEVLDDDYETSDPEEAASIGARVLTAHKQGMFRFNPGRELRIFPDGHPYFGRRGIAHCSIERKHAHGFDSESGREPECEILKQLIEGREEYVRIDTEQGEVYVHRDIGEQERDKNIRTSTYLANRYGDTIYIKPEMPNQTSADAYNVTRQREEEYKVLTKATLNALKRSIRNATPQADHAVIWLTQMIDDRTIARALGSNFKDHPNLQSVRIIFEDGTYDRVYTRPK